MWQGDSGIPVLILIIVPDLQIAIFFYFHIF